MKFIVFVVTQLALARMTPYIGGPDPFKIRIIPRVVTYNVICLPNIIGSIFLFVGVTRSKLSTVYRLSAIRQISGSMIVALDLHT